MKTLGLELTTGVDDDQISWCEGSSDIVNTDCRQTGVFGQERKRFAATTHKNRLRVMNIPICCNICRIAPVSLLLDMHEFALLCETRRQWRHSTLLAPSQVARAFHLSNRT